MDRAVSEINLAQSLLAEIIITLFEKMLFANNNTKSERPLKTQLYTLLLDNCRVSESWFRFLGAVAFSFF